MGINKVARQIFLFINCKFVVEAVNLAQHVMILCTTIAPELTVHLGENNLKGTITTKNSTIRK